jgi:hypothetical protein
MIKVYFWADGTWCKQEDLEHYLTFCSDDYAELNVPLELDDDSIEALVFNTLNFS